MKVLMVLTSHDGVATKVRFNQVVETGVPGFIPRDR